jgi:hypothetical protein
VEQSVSVRLQLRRPSDGAVSDPRSFDFLPLDGGGGFWSAKRLKTNYNVFSNILAIGQSSQVPPILPKQNETSDLFLCPDTGIYIVKNFYKPHPPKLKIVQCLNQQLFSSLGSPVLPKIYSYEINKAFQVSGDRLFDRET